MQTLKDYLLNIGIEKVAQIMFEVDLNNKMRYLYPPNQYLDIAGQLLSLDPIDTNDTKFFLVYDYIERMFGDNSSSVTLLYKSELEKQEHHKDAKIYPVSFANIEVLLRTYILLEDCTNESLHKIFLEMFRFGYGEQRQKNIEDIILRDGKTLEPPTRENIELQNIVTQLTQSLDTAESKPVLKKERDSGSRSIEDMKQIQKEDFLANEKRKQEKLNAIHVEIKNVNKNKVF